MKKPIFLTFLALIVLYIFVGHFFLNQYLYYFLLPPTYIGTKLLDLPFFKPNTNTFCRDVYNCLPNEPQHQIIFTVFDSLIFLIYFLLISYIIVVIYHKFTYVKKTDNS